jgi:hypothetical protein
MAAASVLVDITADWKANGADGFDYAFGCLKYYRDDLYHPLPGAGMKQVQVDDARRCVNGFPYNIHSVYYYEVRQYEDDNWRLIGQLKNGTFFYYEASCCYTGFEVKGDMRLCLSASINELLERGVQDTVRNHVYRFQKTKASADPELTMEQYHKRSEKFQLGR